MKTLRRVLTGLVALVVLVALGVYFNLNRIVKHEVEGQGTASLRLATALDAARLSLFGGKIGLHGLSIASPKGFSAPHMFELGDLDVAVQYKELRGQPIHVASLRLDKAKLVVEQSNGAFNFRKAMELQPQKPPDKNPMQLVIDEIRIDGAQVILHPGLPGIPQEIAVPIPARRSKRAWEDCWAAASRSRKAAPQRRSAERPVASTPCPPSQGPAVQDDVLHLRARARRAKRPFMNLTARSVLPLLCTALFASACASASSSTAGSSAPPPQSAASTRSGPGVDL